MKGTVGASTCLESIYLESIYLECFYTENNYFLFNCAHIISLLRSSNFNYNYVVNNKNGFTQNTEYSTFNQIFGPSVQYLLTVKFYSNGKSDYFNQVQRSRHLVLGWQGSLLGGGQISNKKSR
jgi:hypothetical protein